MYGNSTTGRALQRRAPAGFSGPSDRPGHSTVPLGEWSGFIRFWSSRLEFFSHGIVGSLLHGVDFNSRLLRFVAIPHTGAHTLQFPFPRHLGFGDADLASHPSSASANTGNPGHAVEPPRVFVAPSAQWE